MKKRVEHAAFIDGEGVAHNVGSLKSKDDVKGPIFVKRGIKLVPAHLKEDVSGSKKIDLWVATNPRDNHALSQDATEMKQHHLSKNTTDDFFKTGEFRIEPHTHVVFHTPDGKKQERHELEFYPESVFKIRDSHVLKVIDGHQAVANSDTGEVELYIVDDNNISVNEAGELARKLNQKTIKAIRYEDGKNNYRWVRFPGGTIIGDVQRGCEEYSGLEGDYTTLRESIKGERKEIARIEDLASTLGVLPGSQIQGVTTEGEDRAEREIKQRHIRVQKLTSERDSLIEEKDNARRRNSESASFIRNLRFIRHNTGPWKSDSDLGAHLRTVLEFISERDYLKDIINKREHTGVESLGRARIEYKEEVGRLKDLERRIRASESDFETARDIKIADEKAGIEGLSREREELLRRYYDEKERLEEDQRAIHSEVSSGIDRKKTELSKRTGEIDRRKAELSKRMGELGSKIEIPHAIATEIQEIKDTIRLQCAGDEKFYSFLTSLEDPSTDESEIPSPEKLFGMNTSGW